MNEYKLVKNAIKERLSYYDLQELDVPTMAARVIAGAYWLDTVDPTWMSEIQPEYLDMGDECACTLGQVVGNYSACDTKHRDSPDTMYYGDPNFAEQKKAAEKRGLVLSHEVAIALGFHANEIEEESNAWQALTLGWAALIEARQAAAELA